MENYILYETTNLVNGKKYRGIHKTKNLEDGYLGSGTALKLAVKKYGEENFSRDIIEFCESYDELLIKESIYVNEEWVNDKSNYNLKTGGQSAGILSQESKDKISETLKQTYSNGYFSYRKDKIFGPLGQEHKESISKTLKETWSKQVHNRLGMEPWNKGKKGLQIAWNKGLEIGPMTEEEKEKRSKTLKERWKTHKHHAIGQEPWNKGKKGFQDAWNKGKVMDKTECPHCGKLVDIGNGKRWHFDNCKEKPTDIVISYDNKFGNT
jgi:hypothetical protein